MFFFNKRRAQENKKTGRGWPWRRARGLCGLSHLEFCIGLLLVSTPAGLLTAATRPSPYDSFESGVPAHWQPSRAGSLTTSSLHYKHGSHSLAWSFQNGETLGVRQSLGDIKRTGGYGGSYAKASFGVWLYSEKPQAGALRFEFQTKGVTSGYFIFPLDFYGWRRAHLKYDSTNDFEGRVAPDTDGLRIAAEGVAPNARVFFDLVVYNGVLDYRQQYVPSRTAWRPVLPDPSRFPRLAKPEPEEREGLLLLGHKLDRSLNPGTPLSAEALATLEADTAKLGIHKDEQGIRGLPIVHVQWKEFYEGIPGIHTADEIVSVMTRLSKAYGASTNEALRQKVGGLYALLCEQIRDQGMNAASGFTWNWYPGVPLSDANFFMREPLKAYGLLPWAAQYLEYNYGTDLVYDDNSFSPNMDYFHNDLRPKLFAALLQTNEGEKARYLRALKRRLDMDLVDQSANGFKPDGSAFHHGFHYFAYASYSVNSLVNQLDALAGGPWQVGPEALARVKKVLLNMRFYCNERDLPLSLSGRHPFSLSLNPAALETLSRVMAQNGKPDRDLAMAYLRLNPVATNENLYRTQGLKPEGHPQGNLVMNYAGLLAQRRGDWLATVKGYSKYALFGEIYAKNNRFGRYLSMGYLDILSGGKPVGREGSGCAQPGWDWNRLDGTTTVHLPLEKLAAVSTGTEVIPTEESFVGGLSFRGRQGLFVFPFQGAPQHDPSFKGVKSYFFFDDRIYCLGQGIENNDREHETETTLFQKNLTNESQPQWLPEGPVNYFPWEHQGEVPHWLMDPQGTGYYLPPGQRLHMSRSIQTSRDHGNTSNTEGIFSTAYLSHGRAPKGATYEYAVFPRTSPARMAAFASNMLTEQKPYAVLRRDPSANILFDRGTGITGAVFLKAQPVTLLPPIKAVDAPCLVMSQTRGDTLYLTVADPDLALTNFISEPHTITISLAGSYALRPGSAYAEVYSLRGGNTRVIATCREGRSVDLELGFDTNVGP